MLNCSIAGVPYAQYKKLKKGKGAFSLTSPFPCFAILIPSARLRVTFAGNVDTQAFSDELHQRVLQYQNELFDARELNVRKRAEEPAMAAAVRSLFLVIMLESRVLILLVYSGCPRDPVDGPATARAD